MSYKVFLYDLDGTTIDTSPGIIHALRELEKKLNITPHGYETLTKFIGPPLEDSFEKYFGATHDEAIDMGNLYREIYGKNGINGIAESKCYPHIRESLRYIREKGGKSAITSLKTDSLVVDTLDVYDLAKEFDTLVGRSAENPTKKKTIEEALRRLEWTDKSKVVLFGDSKYDADGAKEAGISFVPLTYGFGFSDEKTLHEIDYVAVFRKPYDLFDFVKKQF